MSKRKRRPASTYEPYDPAMANDLHRAIAASLRQTRSPPTGRRKRRGGGGGGSFASHATSALPATTSAVVARITRSRLPESVRMHLVRGPKSRVAERNRPPRVRKKGRKGQLASAAAAADSGRAKAAALMPEPYVGTARVAEPGGGATQRWTAHVVTDMEMKGCTEHVDAGRATARRPNGGWLRVAGTYNTLIEAALAHDGVAVTTLGVDASTNFGFLGALKKYRAKLLIAQRILQTSLPAADRRKPT